MSQRAWDIAGAFFFRVRSFAPLPLIGVVLWNAWRGHIVEGPFDAPLNWLGLALCLLGASIRFVTVATIPAGTSLQSRRLQARSLNTDGPYAVVRHPLYLGNFHITLGLLCIANEPWAWAVGLAYVFLSQLLIVRAEDAVLRQLFGAAFDTWAADVPAWRPRVSFLPQVFRRPFAWKRAVQREVNPLVAWGCGATLLLMWETFARSRLSSALGLRGLLVLAALLVLLIANKVWKKVSPA